MYVQLLKQTNSLNMSINNTEFCQLFCCLMSYLQELKK